MTRFLRLNLLLLTFCCAFASNAQTYTVTISGSTTATVGQSKNYTLIWRNASGQVVSAPAGGTGSWMAPNAIITNATSSSCTVQWVISGSRILDFEYYTFDAGYGAILNVSVTGSGPATPSTTFSFTQNCNSTLVTRNTNPPAGVEWYWQTSSNGTSTTLGSAASITVSTTSSIFLRARTTSSGAQSTSTLSTGTIPLTTPPAAPATATNGDIISSTGGLVPLSVATVSGATAYQWFDTPTSGTAISGVTATTYSPTVTQTKSFYVQAMKGTCASLARKEVIARVHPLPAIFASGNVNMGASATLSLNYGYDNYQWKKDGVNIVGATSPTYSTTFPATYSVAVKKVASAEVISAGITLSNGGSGQNKNYVVSNTMLVKIASTARIDTLKAKHTTQTIQYVDGLGRPLQQIATQATPAGKDMVQAFSYDAYGRETVKYLPYASGTNGWYKTDFFPKDHISYATAANNQYQFYQNTTAIASDAAPYAQTNVEASPLERPIEQGAPGTAWQPDNTDSYASPVDKAVKFAYEFNQASEVLLWTSKLPTTSVPMGIVNTGSGTTPAYYNANQLRKNRTKDEQKNEVIEYVDKEGRTILKRVQATSTANASTTDTNRDTNWASTYYIYDDFGNLVCVIPPEASKLLPAEYYQSLADDASKNTFLKRWAFRYVYDTKNRMIKKQDPGAEEVYMVYDKFDRIVFTQDAVQRKNKDVSNNARPQWSYTKYDVLSRPIITGIYTHDSVVSQTRMSTLVSKTKFYEKADSTLVPHGYTNTVFHHAKFIQANFDVLTVTYYDDRSYRTLITNAGTTDARFDYKSTEYTEQYKFNNSPKSFRFVKGMATATKVKVLGDTKYLWTVSYYDDKFRVVQSVSTNALGGIDRTTNVYDFVRLTKTKTVHNEGVAGVQIIERKFNFDNAGRTTKIWHNLNNAGWTLLAMNEYNELGQLIDKKLHNTDLETTPDASRVFKQSVDYRYNIRGWLKSINDLAVTEAGDLFGMNLNYNTPTANGGPIQFNGNISEILWKSADGQNQSYAYTYDEMNRLKEGKYYNTTNAAKNNRFNETIANGLLTGYDLNGNIRYLQRNGKTGVTGGITTYGLMDDMKYNTYDGNQLLKIVDDGIDTEGFVDGINGANDYAYDANGNMYQDHNKLITDASTLNGNSRITYNHLNLVDKVVKSNGEYLKYIYDATGRKLSQIVYNASNVQQKRTDYAGEFIYEGTTGSTTLQFINHEEGRIIPAGNEYQYYLKDIWNNTRLTFTTKEVTEAPIATMEPSNATIETANFLRAINSRKVQYFAFDRTNGKSPTTTTGYAERLSGGANEKYGLARSLSVMPGDKVTAEVYAKYIDPVSGNRSGDLNTFLGQVTSLIAAGTTGSGTVIDGGSFSSSTSSFPFPTQASSNTGGSSGTGPKAYLNWLVFDRDYNWISSKSGYKRISATPKEMGQDVDHELLFSPEISIDVAGYVYVFLSNEESTPIDVYFDDFKVTQIKSSVVAMDDYYPFGLTFNSYKRENSVENRIKFQAQERISELGLNWDSFKYRNYMPEIGRFFGIDPLAAQYVYNSPFAFAENKLGRGVELEGLELGSFLTGAFNRIVTNHHPTQAGKDMGRENAAHQYAYDQGTKAGDVVSLIVGAYEMYAGGTTAVVGTVAAPETGGTSLVVAGEGLILAGTGTMVIKNAFANLMTGSIKEKPLSELTPLHSPETTEKTGKDITNLSDEDLLNSANNPENGDFVKENTKTGKLMDGNTRVNELKKRAADPNNKKIESGTPIKVQEHTPDDSMFEFNFGL